MGRPMKYPAIHVGDMFDDLIVTNETVGKNYEKFYTVKCERCGREKVLPRNCLYRHKGTTHRACGKGEKLKDKRFHTVWCSLRARTTNPHYEHYADYGGRGIKSDAFENFIDFYDSMYDSYLEAKERYSDDEIISIDRINVNGNYEPSNCRWISMKEQKGNMRRNRWFEAISPTGEKFKAKNQADFAKKHNLSDKQVNACLSGRFKTTRKWKFKFINECNDYPEKSAV